MTSIDTDIVKVLVDAYGMRNMLQTLQNYCEQRSHNCRHYSQDEETARSWLLDKETLSEAERKINE